METINKLIAIYARVSTSHQEEEGTIQSQINAVKEYAEKRGYKIVKEYIDDGWSGDLLARPNLDQLRSDARSGQWEAVLIYDPDRLARRYSYQELVMDELQEAGKEVIFVTVTSPKNKEDKILYGVRGLFAEYERAKITERFRLGKVRKIKEGHILLSEAPYGYTYVKKYGKEHGYLVVNEEEAEIVRRIFDWVAVDKMTLRSVVRKLLNLGIAPRKSKRGVWNTSTLSTMLRNEVYIGKAHWGKSVAIIPENPLKQEKYQKNKKTSRRIKPREEWDMYQVDVPAIIEKSIFEAVGQQLKANFAQCKRNKKNEYLLSNLIWCPCGRTRTGEGVLNGKHLYYRCTDRVLSYPLPRNCYEMGVNARVADNLVWDKIASLMSSPSLLIKQIERWLKIQKSKTTNLGEDPELLQKQIDKLKKQVERHDLAYGAGVYTLEHLKEVTAPIREQIGKLTKTLAEAEIISREQKATKMPTNEEVASLVERVQKNINTLNFSQKRDIVLSTVERIIASPRELAVSGYIPVNSVNHHVEYKSISRHRLNTTRHDAVIPFSFKIRMPSSKAVVLG